MAKKDGVSVAQVQREIAAAIRLGRASVDPSVRVEWEKMPNKGKTPTPVALIAYLSELASQSNGIVK